MNKPPELAKLVVFCIPTVTQPYQCTLDSLAASVPLIEAAGWAHRIVYEVGSPYISCARSIMLRKALDAMATHVVFIDHDISWEPKDLLDLIEADGDVVAGTYRFKTDDGQFMGALQPDADGYPQVRDDGAVKAWFVPAGFLKVTRIGVSRFIQAYPELTYGDKCNPCVDLFNHGAHEGRWYGEDYAFSRRWRDLGGEIWILPHLNIVHHNPDKSFGGTFHDYLCRQPGGSQDPDGAAS